MRQTDCDTEEDCRLIVRGLHNSTTTNTDINENTRGFVKPEDTELSNLLLLMNCTFQLQEEDCVISFFKHAERVPSNICVYKATVVLLWDTVKISNEL